MKHVSELFNDMGRIMTNAAGVAQGVREEALVLARSSAERLIADMDIVSREEFDAVRIMAQNAREENIQLRAELEALRQQVPGDGHDRTDLPDRAKNPDTAPS